MGQALSQPCLRWFSYAAGRGATSRKSTMITGFWCRASDTQNR